MSGRLAEGGRRRWLTISLASIAAGAGASFAWRQYDEGSDAAVSDAFWQMSFEQPAGGTLAMQSLRGKPLLLNFWATWCPPCLQEMPLLDRFHREHGWPVLGLAVDQAAPVQAYLQRLRIGFPIGLVGPGGLQLSRDLGNAGGQLPYSVVFDSRGRVAARHLGVVDEAQLSRWQRAVD